MYKFIIDFGTNAQNECKAKETRTEELFIKNKGKDTLKFIIENPIIDNNDYHITITPSTGELKKVLFFFIYIY